MTRAMYDQAQRFLAQAAAPMPENKRGLRNGTLLTAEEAIGDAGAACGITAGMMFPIFWDGTYVRAGNPNGPSWSVSQMEEEFERGWWFISGQLDECREEHITE